MKINSISRSLLLLLAVGSIATLSYAPPVLASEDEITKEEAASQESAGKAGWADALKQRYNLTDEQIKQMRDKGMNNPQMAIAAQLSQASGKPLEDVVKMRQEQKMGWGKIAKELGVHPGEIGKSISSLRHEVNGERKEAKMAEKLDAKMEKQEERLRKREEKLEARREKREAKQMERAERKAKQGK